MARYKFEKSESREKSGDSETDTEKVYFLITEKLLLFDSTLFNFALEMNPLLKGIGG